MRLRNLDYRLLYSQEPSRLPTSWFCAVLAPYELVLCCPWTAAVGTIKVYQEAVALAKAAREMRVQSRKRILSEPTRLPTWLSDLLRPFNQVQ